MAALAPRIAHLKPCREAVKWLQNRTLEQAWKDCDNGPWMIWLAARTVPRPVLVRCLVTFVREVALPHVPKGEDRPWYATEVAFAWCDGRATLTEVKAAAVAAYAAAYAASYVAPYVAAYSAAVAAEAAAYAYAGDAAAYADAAAAYAAADDAAKRRIREIIREMIPVALIEEGLTRA